MVALFNIFAGTLFGWFSQAYTLTLYKQARSGLEKETGSSLTWVWIVTVLGWLLVLLSSFALIRVITSGILQNTFKDENKTNIGTEQIKSINIEATQLINSGQIKINTANQIAQKTNITDQDKNQITGLINGALDDYNKAVEIDPTSQTAWYYRGVAYKNLMDANVVNADKFAIESFEKSIELNQQDYLSYLEIGSIYYQQKNYQKAIINFQQVVKLNPNFANGYYNLGMAYKAFGAPTEAKKAFEKASELLPKDDPTRYLVDKELNSL